MNPEATLLLFECFLSGLAFLHDEKRVMHRDIKPGNLGVVSLDPPHGILLDMDLAIRSETSSDHMEGSTPYLAPEIIAWKVWNKDQTSQKPDEYGKAVDVWAMGLSVFSVEFGLSHSWRRFIDPSRKPQKSEEEWVDQLTHDRFRARLRSRRSTAGKDSLSSIALSELSERMTEWRVDRRTRARDALKSIQALGISKAEGVFKAKSGHKRQYEGA